MQAHRFREQLEEMTQRRSQPVMAAGSFLLCPMPVLALAPERSMLQQVYQMAFEQAQAVVRPSWLERDPLGVWN